MNDNKPAVVLNTCPDAATADRIATALVKQNLAACVNILPGIRSIYRWQGETERAEECLLLIKGRADAFDEICNLITSQHPYELPEVVMVPISDGLKPYLEWINNPEQ